MRPQAVLFDAAGTLIELAEPLGETYARIGAHFGAPISAWRLENAFARCFRRAPPMVFPNAPPEEVGALERAWWRELTRTTFLAADSAVRPRDFDACFDALWRHFAAAAAWRVRAGAHQALRALRAADLRCAVVSNFDRRLHGLLAGLDLADALDAVVLPSESRAAKPDPAPLLLALARLGCEPAAGVFVGDDPERDLAPARRLGLHAVDVRELATLAELPQRVALLSHAAGTGGSGP
jgi:putative hydrolase of the HAD superfamily